MRYVLAFLFLLVSTVAISQGCGPSNPGCIVPTAPPGTNNNQAASTAFVQNAVTGGGGGITALTGDVAASGSGSVTATIQPGVVTSAKMAAGAASANVGTLGGVLGGTLPNPTMAAGAAATNVGTLGGVLGGTLPNPTMAAGAAATNVGTLGGALTGTLPNPNIANSVVFNSMLANMLADTVKCNATGSAAAPTDCSPNTIANLLGYCVIDGSTFALSVAGIQSAINTTSCHDIYIPPGSFSGTSQLQIARSNVRIHGAGGVVSEQTFSTGTIASTILSFTCFNPGANPAVLVGDGNATLTYSGIEISDLAISLPASCNMIGAQVNTSTTDVPNVFRRVRITQASGTASGTGIFLGNNVYNWSFEHVVIDHFSQCYRFSGVNNLTKVLQGSCSDGNVGINAQNSLANQTGSAIIDGVDFENMVTTAIDLGSTDGFWIQNCYFGQGSGGVNSLSIRLGNVASQIPQGVVISHNLFNAGGSANYAIDLEATAGFKGLTIDKNTFVGYVTDNVRNQTTTTGSLGAYTQNYTDGSAGALSANAGFLVIEATAGALQLGAVSGQNINFTDGNNGNDFVVVGFGSAVANQLTARGNSTGNPPTLSATGTDTNIGLGLVSKGTQSVGMWGTGTTWPGLLLGLSGASLGNGSVTFNGNTSGSFTISVPSTGGTPTMSTPWPIAAGGTGDTGTAWTAYTPTVSCGTATFSDLTGGYKTLGKTVFMRVEFLVSTVGNCVSPNPTNISVSLPVNLSSTTGASVSMGAGELDNGGLIVCSTSQRFSTTTLLCQRAGGGFPVNGWQANDYFGGSTVYESN